VGFGFFLRQMAVTIDQESTTPAIAPPAVQAAADARRLRVGHLMWWAVASAVSLTILRSYYTANELSGPQWALLGGYSTAQGVLLGGLLTGGAVLGFARLHHGPPLALHPGHWLLCIGAGGAVAVLALLCVGRLGGGRFAEGSWLAVPYGAICLGQAVGYGFATRASEMGRWRVLFGGLLLASALQGIGYLALGMASGRYFLGVFLGVVQWIDNLGQPLLAGWTLLALGGDYRLRPRRDWLHWLGVATYLGDALLNASWQLVQR
jgi:hypothetical protein